MLAAFGTAEGDTRELTAISSAATGIVLSIARQSVGAGRSRPLLLLLILVNALNGRFSTRIDRNGNGSVAFMRLAVLALPFVVCG